MNDQPTPEETIEQVSQTNEYSFDPATAQPVLHNWVQRGVKLSCEGAGHAHHEVWLKQPQVQKPQVIA